MIDDFLNGLSKDLEEIKDRLNELEGGKIEILGTADIAKILGINRNSAVDLFDREDFPSIKGIKSRKVEKKAFLDWLRHQKLNNSR